MAEHVEPESNNEEDHNLSEKRLSVIVRYDDMYWFQKILYYLIYPVLWFMDLRCIRKRAWFQLPILTYTIEITQIIIAIALVKLCIEGIKSHSVATIYLSIYIICSFIICLLLLYYLAKYTTAFHYHYFVNVSTYIIAYGLLFFFVHIQHTFFSDTIAWSWLWFAILYVISHIVIALSILLKQVLKLSNTDSVLHEYLKYKRFYHIEDPHHDAETVSLLRVEDANPEINRSKALIDLTSHTVEEVEMTSFWNTVLRISVHIWSISIGFILIECIIYSIIGFYVQLLASWKGESTVIMNNSFEMLLIGAALAFVTVFIESVVEIYCKVPCYMYITNNRNAVSDDNHQQCMVFIVSFLSQVSVTWSQILAAAIGWSMLTPNQSKHSWPRFRSALIGTIVFIFVGVIGQKFKYGKEQKVLEEMEQIKNDDFELFKEKKLKSKTTKLILYDRLIKIYNTALAVGVSFAWESFESQWIEEDYKDTKMVVMKVIYALVSVFVYIQFALELEDLRQERLRDAMKESD